MTIATVVLFDIDGTLITSGGVGRRAIELAFSELHGREDACAHFTFDGMTDRAIARAGLAALGLPADTPAIDQLIAAYLRHLAKGVAEAPAQRYRVLEGMHAAISACAAAGFA